MSNVDNRPFSLGGDMGVVNMKEVEALDFSSYLTIAELEEIHQSNHERKRLQKKAVRLLVKTMILSDERSTEPLKLNSALIDQYSIEAYHSLEIVLSESIDKHLAICENGQELNTWISVAHGENTSVVCLSDREGVGIDIEMPQLRRAEFYAQNFTSYEREWIYENINSNMDEDWLFTFLWTIKESLIKSGCTTQQSAWYIPQFSIERLPHFEQFDDTSETCFSIYDGKEYFIANTRVYPLGTQILTTSFFYK